MAVLTQQNTVHDVSSFETTKSRPRFLLVKHQVGAILILAFSVIVAMGALSLPIGTIDKPSPGFWPLVVSCITAVFAIVEFFTGKEESEGFTGQGLRRTLIMVGALLLIPISYEIIGFLLPTFVMILIMMVGLSKQKLWFASLVGV